MRWYSRIGTCRISELGGGAAIALGYEAAGTSSRAQVWATMRWNWPDVAGACVSVGSADGVAVGPGDTVEVGAVLGDTGASLGLGVVALPQAATMTAARTREMARRGAGE
jgi:hypothetical protein